MYDNILENLNNAQLKAVTSTEGFIRVIAGAGSGKTGALTRRFAFLVNEIGIMPGNILCATFTNKAANEMRNRIHELTGDNDTGYINTFHGFCVSVLQEDISAVSYPKNFFVLDNSDIDAMLGLIYEERGLTLRDMTFSRARDMIEIRKIFKEPRYYEDMISMSAETLRARYLESRDPSDIIFYGYLFLEKKCFGLDYNDLLKFTIHILRADENIRLKWQQRLEYIMVDEFQDIDKLQYELTGILCGFHRNLFVVGDPDQTIYSWRGADGRCLLDFDKAFPDASTIMMTQNYRSTPEILAAANSLIDKNKTRIRKDLIPTRPRGEPVLCRHAETQKKESGWICRKINELRDSGIPYGDIAVLYRAHYITRSLEETFLDRKIPYRIHSGVRFYDRREIKDALSYLRMIVCRDDLSFTRVVNVPRRNIGKKRLEFLRAYADRNGCTLYKALTDNIEDDLFRRTGARKFIGLIEMFARDTRGISVSELLSEILDRSGYEKMLRTEGSQERLDNLAELKQCIYDFELSCGEECDAEYYLAHAAMLTNGDLPESGDKVRLMTVHAAKGLEFPYVFLCSMNEGVFPSARIQTLQEMEEERRLAFVAMTRAEKGLFISESGGRKFDGSLMYPSRFILDIDESLIQYENRPEEEALKSARRHIGIVTRNLQDEEAPVLTEGSRVRHAIMGTGTIIAIDQSKQAYKIRFDRLDTPRSLSFRAKLEPEDGPKGESAGNP